MRLGRAVCLLLPWGYVLACGGRFEKPAEGDDQPDGGSSPASGATSSVGGSSSVAGSTSSAGKAGSVGRGGSTSTAGSSTRGGSSTAGNSTRGGSTSTAGVGGACLCDPLGCTPPFREAPDADGCCTHCELDAELCDKAAQDYEAYRNQVIQKYQTLPCMSDSDCGLFFDKNQCRVGFCGAAIVNSEIMSIRENLDSYARTTCSSACPPPPQPACPLIPAPKCVMNHCQ